MQLQDEGTPSFATQPATTTTTTVFELANSDSFDRCFYGELPGYGQQVKEKAQLRSNPGCAAVGISDIGTILRSGNSASLVCTEPRKQEDMPISRAEELS
ncbi:hypothetical protein PAAG_04278 [Paracoccidioides lutzii Pb01]|uniref:Uncharacterized protein n=1 Tax=Paracoccidioides lutzii (strain ATCC MYA-826 / Pb01) TaxID=502779 RepID=C1H0I4_PARBA|nr:hypothetical protein PAAG_04278 [Paracoccidioides lutzii Pb01]EEH33225.2 hypothetical protein PAAG_04278 [Paracoccidioides lutzii Pb01]